MLLDRLTVSNYRRLAHLTIDFHPQLTVISARNGEGKTAILDAAATALGSYVQAFDPGGLQDIQVTDARLVRGRTITGGERQFPVEIVAEALVPEGYTGTEQRVVWRRSLRDPHSRQITDEGANPFATIADQLQADLRADREVPLPALSYYGSNRLQQLHSTKLDKKKPTRSRHAGYQGCLSNYLSHSQLQEWMRDATAAAAQPHQGNRSDPDLSDAVAGIAWSVEEVLGPLAQTPLPSSGPNHMVRCGKTDYWNEMIMQLILAPEPAAWPGVSKYLRMTRVALDLSQGSAVAAQVAIPPQGQ